MADKSFRTIRGKDAKRYTMVEINRYRLLYAGRTSPAIGGNPPSPIERDPLQGTVLQMATTGHYTRRRQNPEGYGNNGYGKQLAPIAESAVLTRAGIHGSRMSVIHFPARMIPRSAA